MSDRMHRASPSKSAVMTFSSGSPSGYGNGRLAMISVLVPPVVSTACAIHHPVSVRNTGNRTIFRPGYTGLHRLPSRLSGSCSRVCDLCAPPAGLLAALRRRMGHRGQLPRRPRVCAALRRGFLSASAVLLGHRVATIDSGRPILDLHFFRSQRDSRSERRNRRRQRFEPSFGSSDRDATRSWSELGRLVRGPKRRANRVHGGPPAPRQPLRLAGVRQEQLHRRHLHRASDPP